MGGEGGGGRWECGLRLKTGRWCEKREEKND